MRDLAHTPSALVFRGGTRVGSIFRDESGTRFQYAENYEQGSLPGGGIAFQMRFQSEPIARGGGAVHPFFANLLPEGHRLTALRERAKASLDDELGLLLAAGPDTIGDISVTAAEDNADPFRVRAIVDASDLGHSDFSNALERSIGGKTEIPEPSLTGIQEKVSAEMISLPVTSSGKRAWYILKLNPTSKPNLIQNESVCLRLAERCKLRVVRHRLVSDRNGTQGLLIERFDRLFAGTKPTKLHIEDACQFCARYPADKYRVTMNEVGEGVRSFASAPKVEILKLIKLYAFSYLICNGDLHAKNISLMQRQDDTISLTPAYDLICTLPYGDQSMALKIEGRDDNFRAADFARFGERFDIPQKATAKMLSDLILRFDQNAPMLDDLPLNTDQRRHLREFSTRRLARLRE